MKFKAMQDGAEAQLAQLMKYVTAMLRLRNVTAGSTYSFCQCRLLYHFTRLTLAAYPLLVPSHSPSSNGIGKKALPFPRRGLAQALELHRQVRARGCFVRQDFETTTSQIASGEHVFDDMKWNPLVHVSTVLSLGLFFSRRKASARQEVALDSQQAQRTFKTPRFGKLKCYCIPSALLRLSNVIFVPAHLPTLTFPFVSRLDTVRHVLESN